MAYALDADEDEKTAGQAAAGAQSLPTPVQAAQGQPATGGGSAPTGNKFIGFEQYLQANQGAAQQTGEKLAQDVTQKGERAKNAIKGAYLTFADQVSAGTPGVLGVTPTTSAQAEQLGSSTYTGPTSLQQVAPGLSGQVQEAGDYARALQTSGGIQTLLQKDQPATYSGALDSALAGASPAASRYAELEQKYGSGGLGKYLQTTEGTAGATAEGRARRVASEAERIKGLAPGLKAQEDQAALDAATNADRIAGTSIQKRNEANRGEYLASRTPVSEQVYSTTDERAALGYGDKVYNAWVEAGRPEFSGWIRSRRR